MIKLLHVSTFYFGVALCGAVSAAPLLVDFDRWTEKTVVNQNTNHKSTKTASRAEVILVGGISLLRIVTEKRQFLIILHEEEINFMSEFTGKIYFSHQLSGDENSFRNYFCISDQTSGTWYSWNGRRYEADKSIQESCPANGEYHD
ncbi:MAG: hypothetical protein AAF583_05460 [Pseudomonadota bacterium]